MFRQFQGPSRTRAGLVCHGVSGSRMASIDENSVSGEAPHETLQSAKLQDYAESLQQLKQGFDNCR